MYSSSDFEHLFIRIQGGGDSARRVHAGLLFENKVPYNLFYKWHKDSRYHIVPVQVEDQSDKDPAKNHQFSYYCGSLSAIPSVANHERYP